MHPIVERAGTRSKLPKWARCSDRRRSHGIRVGDLLAEWAKALKLPKAERVRWRAAGVLHDALKEASPSELAKLAGGDWPRPVAHAPACAERLAAAGVEDESLLDAIRYHPVGHPDLDALGEYLILADYLEPGRKGGSSERASLRARLPDDRQAVLTVVVRRRLERLLARGRPLMPSSVDFWNRLIDR